jgi:hypothetical protein
MRKVTLLPIQSEKGGVGKTHTAEAIVAGLFASAAKLLVVDADDGNSGYAHRAGKGKAKKLLWTSGADALPGWIAANLGDHDTVVIDCGANLIASGAPINDFLGGLVMDVVNNGGRVVALAVVSTNAPGSGRLAQQVVDAYGQWADVRLVQNDQDGSGAFSRSLSTLSMKCARFGHIQPGMQAARLLTRQPLWDVLNSPPMGYAAAMGSYAHKVASFIAEPAVADLFASDAAKHIRALADAAPGNLKYHVSRLKDATDAALAANHAVWVAERARDVAQNGDDDAAFRRAAIEVSQAVDTYRNIIR